MNLEHGDCTYLLKDVILPCNNNLSCHTGLDPGSIIAEKLDSGSEAEMTKS